VPFLATFSPESSVILIETIEVFGAVSVSAPYLVGVGVGVGAGVRGSGQGVRARVRAQHRRTC
jgi:hypothetical protein